MIWKITIKIIVGFVWCLLNYLLRKWGSDYSEATQGTKSLDEPAKLIVVLIDWFFDQLIFFAASLHGKLWRVFSTSLTEVSQMCWWRNGIWMAAQRRQSTDREWFVRGNRNEGYFNQFRSINTWAWYGKLQNMLICMYNGARSHRAR